MQEVKWSSERKGMNGVVRTLIGIVLLVLVIGVWVCLWVPPSSAF
jgi:hypothetical protein